jgi:hypothetical protein
MATREITLYATGFGEDIGPFDITDNFNNIVALGITTQQILSTIILIVDNTADTIFLTSKGRCDNTLSVPINAIAPSPTVSPSVTSSPSVTPSVTPSISISPTVTPSVTITQSPTPSITVTPTRTPTTSTTPSVTPSISISRTPTVTPSQTPTVTPSTSVVGINSCTTFNSTNLYLKVNWFDSGSVSTPSGVYDRYGNYCGDDVFDYAYVTVEFYRNSALTIPVNLSNIRVRGLSDSGLGLQAVGLAADSGLATGILTNNQNSVTFQSIAYKSNSADLTQEDNCRTVNDYYGLRLTFGCSSISTVTVQQNNQIP